MQFTNETKAGRSVKIVDVSVEMRNGYSLTDEEVVELAKYTVLIENHYGRPMDIEWSKNGRDGKLFLLQARPETVKSQHKATNAHSASGRAFPPVLRRLLDRFQRSNAAHAKAEVRLRNGAARS